MAKVKNWINSIWQKGIVPAVDFIWEHPWVFISLFIVFFAGYVLIHSWQLFFAVLGSIGTFMMGIFAWQQHKLERTKYKLEIRPEQKMVYDNLIQLIAIATIDEQYNRIEVNHLISQAQEAAYFLPKQDNFDEYIKIISINLAELDEKRKSEIKLVDAGRNDEAATMKEEITVLENWFIQQNAVVKEKFEKYLRIEE